MPTSADTVLRLVKGMQLPDQTTPRIIGVDDWAKRKGRSYGTIIVNLERHRVIDLLPDRTATTVADWLRQRPGIEVVARDRSTEYASGITIGAPDAVQVADRWNLLAICAKQWNGGWSAPMHASGDCPSSLAAIAHHHRRNATNHSHAGLRMRRLV